MFATRMKKIVLSYLAEAGEVYFLIITQRTLPETTFLTSFHEVPHQADIVFPPVRPRNPPRARRPSAPSGSSRVSLPCSRISPFPSQTPLLSAPIAFTSLLSPRALHPPRSPQFLPLSAHRHRAPRATSQPTVEIS